MVPRLVATRLPASAASLRVIERVWAAGDALLPLDPGLTETEAAELVARTRPHLLFDVAGETSLDDAMPVTGHAALVIATSGTTGQPKAVLLRHAALDAAVRLTNSRVGAEPGQRWLCCLPLSHIAGLMTVLRSRALGTDPVIHPRFDVDAVGAETGAAFVSLVPTMLHRLLEAGADLTSFSTVLVGGAAVPAALIARAQRAGAKVSVTYGMTETAGGVVYDGIPLPGVGIELDDEGRISIASPTVMEGYRLDPAATERALAGGRFVTQDKGSWRQDGTLEILGRLDRTIVTGGKNVSPDEVEVALRLHPAVLDAVVRGEPDDRWGQRIVAAVTPREPTTPPTSLELVSFLRERLSAYKLPRTIRVISADEGTGTPTGKTSSTR